MKSLLSAGLLLLVTFIWAPELKAQGSAEFPTVRFDNHLEKEEYRYLLGVAIDPLQSLFGYYPVTVQVAAFDMFKFDVAAGLCSKPLLPRQTASSTTAEANYNPRLGFEIGVKYYPGEFVYDDSYYVGVSLKKLRYSFEEELSADNFEYYNLEIYDLNLIYGYDLPLDIENFYLDMYIGNSIRFQNLYYSRESANSLDTPTQLVDIIRLTLGVKIGYLIR